MGVIEGFYAKFLLFNNEIECVNCFTDLKFVMIMDGRLF